MAWPRNTYESNFNAYPVAVGSAELCDRPLLLNYWKLPPGYNPALALVDPHQPTLTVARGFGVQSAGRLPPHLDASRALQPFTFDLDPPIPAGLIGEFRQGQYLPVDTEPFTVGVSVVGGPDAIGIAGNALHGTLP